MVDRGKPDVQIFADTEAALARMCQTAETAECRIVSAHVIPAAFEPSSRTVPGAAILIELEGKADADAAIPLLDWLCGEAERGACRGVISGSAELIDLIAARAGDAGIAHLCAADESERLAAIHDALQPREAKLHDAGRERVRLAQPGLGYELDTAGPADTAFVRAMIRSRRRRGHYLPVDLFADPVWDMLLDLLAARLEARKVAVSSLCIAAAVPPTTALRWLGVMVEQGLLRRVADPEDRRRCHVELTAATARALGAWLRETRRLAAETA